MSRAIICVHPRLPEYAGAALNGTSPRARRDARGMPRNYPVEPDAAERRSHAERVVWAALQELPDEAVVISQFRVVDDRGVLREADFVVLIPDVGVGVVEVKGGLVWAVDGEWISRDSRGRDHSIKDPMFQAQKAGFAIRDFVTGQGVAWPSWVPVVILPDTRLRADFAPPDSKRGDWIDGRAHLAARLSAAVHTGEDLDADELVAVMERRLPRPSPRQKAELAARRADTITRDQYPILRALRSTNRILVTGGPARTGGRHAAPHREPSRRPHHHRPRPGLPHACRRGLRGGQPPAGRRGARRRPEVPDAPGRAPRRRRSPRARRAPRPRGRRARRRCAWTRAG